MSAREHAIATLAGSPSRAEQRSLTIWQHARAFAMLARITARSRLAFPAQAALAMVASVVGGCFYVLIWAEVLRRPSENRGLDPETMLPYLVTALILNSVLTLVVETRFAIELRKGQIVGVLLRPLGFVPMQLAQAVGDVIGNLLFAAPLFVIGLAVLGDILLPADGVALLLGVVSAGLGLLVNFSLSLLAIDVASLTSSMYGVTVARAASFQALSGVSAPIDVLPAGLRKVASCLPFRHVIETPVLIWHGRLPLDEALYRIATQVGWAAVLLCLGTVSFHHVLSRQQIQGG
jgi:ABC-2 type transport system permease protein